MPSSTPFTAARLFALSIPLAFLAACHSSTPAASTAQPAQQDTLHSISNPGGGRIIYGPLVQQSSLESSMGVMLRTIRAQFGDRPQVGRFFQARGSTSVATFFTVTAKNDANRPIAGLVVVSMPPGTHPSAAILYDDAPHFGASLNPMMKQLNTVWKPEAAPAAAAPQSSGTAPAAPAAPALPALHQSPLPDNSASIGLPAGWRITGGGHGQLHAEGAEGQQIHFISYMVIDPRGNPRYRPGMRLPGAYVAYPFGDDPTRAFPAIAAQFNQKVGAPAPSYTFSSSKNLGPSPVGNCILAGGTVDRHDGKGTLAHESTLCVRQGRNGNWAMAVYQVATPTSRANIDGPLLAAIERSYKLNDAVLNRQTQATIAQIHQIGDNARRQADAAHAAEDAHNASVEAHWDAMDRRSQDFSNYLLDQSVVQSSNGGRATVWNTYANTLVEGDPTHFQYVSSPDFIKGIDY